MTFIQPPHFEFQSAVVQQQQPTTRIHQARDVVLKLVDEGSWKTDEQLGIFRRLTSCGKRIVKSSIVSMHRVRHSQEHKLLDGLDAELIQLEKTAKRSSNICRLSEEQLQLIVRMATHDDAVLRSRIRDQSSVLLWGGLLSSRVIHISRFDAANPQHISALRWRCLELDAYLALMNLNQSVDSFARVILSNNSMYKSIPIPSDDTLEERVSKYLDPKSRVQAFAPDHRGVTVMIFDGVSELLRRNS